MLKDIPEFKVDELETAINIIDVSIDHLFQDMIDSIESDTLGVTNHNANDFYKNRIKDLYEVKCYLKSKQK
jgi:hypothetical protein